MSAEFKHRQALAGSTLSPPRLRIWPSSSTAPAAGRQADPLPMLLIVQPNCADARSIVRVEDHQGQNGVQQIIVSAIARRSRQVGMPRRRRCVMPLALLAVVAATAMAAAVGTARCVPV